MHSQEEPPAVLQRWGLVGPASRGPKARLTLDEVVREAVALADADGFEAVTLGALAKRLGLTTTALYRYVDSKDTLTELMVDDGLGGAPTLPDADPHEAVLAWVEAAWARYAAHPWLATFPIRRAPRCPHAFAWLEALLVPLTAAGDDDALGLAMTIDVLVRGYAGLSRASEGSTLGDDLGAEIARRHPALAAQMTRDVSPRLELDRAVRRLLA